MHYKLPFFSKTLVFVALLLKSPPLCLALQPTSAYNAWTFQDAETQPGCKLFPCPSPLYPPNNTCTNFTASTTDPFTNITKTTTETYMLVYNLPKPYSLGDCKNTLDSVRDNLFGCNSVDWSQNGSFHTIVLCDLTTPRHCINEFGFEEEEAWRLGGKWGDECAIYCNPCAITFKPLPVGFRTDEHGGMRCVVVNRDALPSPIRKRPRW